jgi:hypothetical protein
MQKAAQVMLSGMDGIGGADADMARKEFANIAGGGSGGGARSTAAAAGGRQGLTLVHFSACLDRFVWDKGCAQVFCRPCQGGGGGCLGCVGCFLVSDAAQVELRSERV